MQRDAFPILGDSIDLLFAKQKGINALNDKFKKKNISLGDYAAAQELLASLQGEVEAGILHLRRHRRESLKETEARIITLKTGTTKPARPKKNSSSEELEFLCALREKLSAF